MSVIFPLVAALLLILVGIGFLAVAALAERDAANRS